MKKLISLILIIALLVQAVPVYALAGAGGTLTDAQMREAFQLAGLQSDASGIRYAPSTFHRGMTPDKTWNARMLREWIQDLLDFQLSAVSDTFLRAESLLNRMKSEDSASYNRFIHSYPNGTEIYNLSREQSATAVQVREDLQLYKARLEEHTVMIEQMAGLLMRGNLYEYEVRRYSNNILRSAHSIEAIRNEIVGNSVNDVRVLSEYASVINGSYTGSDPRCRAMNNWLGEVFSWETRDAVDAEGKVTAGRAGDTLRRRLQAAGSGSILGDSSADAKIHIRSENELYFQFFDENEQPMKDVEVTVWDENSPDRTSATCTSDESGYAYISCENFISDEDKEVWISLQVNASQLGYQDFYAPRVYMTRGEVRTEYMKKVVANTPYVYSADFEDYDIIRKEWNMLFSSENDYNFDIHLTLSNTSGKENIVPVLHYYRFYSRGGDVLESAYPTETEGNTYTFRGPWKSYFSPDSEIKPYFTLDTQETEKLETMLTSTRTAVDQPTYSGDEVTSPLNTLLKDGFGVKFSITVAPGLTLSVGFNLPLSNYWPKITGSPSGVMIAFGSKLTDPEDLKGNWKNQNQKDYDRQLKQFENMSYTARQKAQIGAAYDYYKQDNVDMMKEMSTAFGWFGVFAGRWQKDEDFDTWLITVSGTTGIIFSFSYTMTQPCAIGPVPIYMSLTFGLSVGFCVGLDVEFVCRSGEYDDFRFGAFPEVTIEIAFSVTATAGAGIKGIASIYISGTFCFNIAIALAPQTKPKVTPSVSAYITVGVELFIFSMSAVLIAYPDSLARSSDLTLFDLFMSRARAESEPEKTKVVDQTPYRYPELAPAAEKVVDSLENASHNFHVVAAGDGTFAFYLFRDTDSGAQIRWKNLDTGSEGTIKTPSSQIYAGLQPYCLDAYTDGENVYLLTCLSEPFSPEDGWPAEDDVYKGFMAGYSINGDGSLSEAGSTVFDPTEGLSYTTLAEPHIEKASMDGGLNMIAAFGQIAAYGNHTAILSYKDGTNPVWHSQEGITSGTDESYRFKTVNPLFTGTYEFEDSVRSGFIALAEPDGTDWHTNTAIELYDSAMEEAPEGERTTIVLMPGHFGFYRIIQLPDEDGNYTQTIFYSDKERQKKAGSSGDDPDEMVKYRLKGVHVPPKEFDPDYRWTTYSIQDRDYDVSLPTEQFDEMILGTNVLLYWLETAPVKNADDPTVWRVTCVNYDIGSDVMSDKFVIAEFTLPDSVRNGRKAQTVPVGITLTETGYGYLSTVPDPSGEASGVLPASLYRFPINLKPVIDMQGLTLSETLVTPNQMIDTTMTLMNAGSMNITSYDMELVQVMDDGSEGPVLETLHCDCVHPENNKVTMASGKIVVKGEAAVYREDEYIFSGRQHDWETSLRKMVFRIQNGIPQPPQVSPDEPRYVETGVMVPGSLASFVASICIPDEEDWKGDIMLRLRVSGINAITKMPYRTPGLSGSGSKNDYTIPAGARELTYRRNRTTGKLELQETLLTAQERALYAKEISSTSTNMPLTVEHQDIAVDYRLGKNASGDPMLDIVISNMVNNRKNIALTCAVYPDGSDTPYYVSLPYYEEYVAAGKTQTISMPLTSLADPSQYSTIRVVFRGRGVKESTYSNNEFNINLRGLSSGTLRIVQQPEDATVKEGETALFTTSAAGGVVPYAYRWEVRMGESVGWQKIEGADGETLAVKDTKQYMTGWKYRCTVTDTAGNPVTSQEANMTVVRIPVTGDSSNLTAYLILAAAALALLFLLLRKRHGEEKPE